MIGLPTTIIIVGAGNMARAMLQGWQSKAIFHKIYTVDPHQSIDIPDCVGLSHVDELPRDIDNFILLFAVKPQILPDILSQWQQIAVRARMVFSLAAGISCLGVNVIRLMPNTPVAVGQGIIGYYNQNNDIADNNIIDALLFPLGMAIRVKTEDELNKITAFSGSGPAYIYAFVESLTNVAQSLGFGDDAGAMAKYLLRGSLTLLENSPQSATTLREAVTSAGGTTAAAMTYLLNENNGLYPLLQTAINAAFDRANQLSELTPKM